MASSYKQLHVHLSMHTGKTEKRYGTVKHEEPPNKKQMTISALWAKSVTPAKPNLNTCSVPPTHNSGEKSTTVESDHHLDKSSGIVSSDNDKNQLLSSPDIASFLAPVSVPDDIKHYFIINRAPQKDYKFPAKEYKDKRKSDGVMKRYCSPEWFHMFKFICYSKKSGEEGLFCLACVLFPDNSHRRAKKLICEPYSNWKDAKADLKTHSTLDYHKNSMAKLTAFQKTYTNMSSRIDVALRDDNSTRVAENRVILTQILKCVEFCGRQGIGLRGHRDDDTEECSSFNKGNFKALLNFRIDAGDKVLESHLETCARNAKYTSKTTQNNFLLCIKEFIQQHIIREVNSQPAGPYFSIQCDEVTDSSNWEQLGIVIRYVKDNQPIERLLEFVKCEDITGETLANKIMDSLTKAGLDIKLCRFQTMDGAGNMAGKKSGCSTRITKENPKALYIHCASHELNLALCKSCKIPEITAMLDTLTQLGLFFQYSPKRSRRFEKAIAELSENDSNDDSNIQFSKKKLKTFCETRWVEKQTTLIDFNDLYEPILLCLEAISSLEVGWDTKAVSSAYGLLKRITDSTFIASFQIVLNIFGYIKGLSTLLQGSSLDIIKAYQMVDQVRSMIAILRTDESEYEDVFHKIEKMAKFGGTDVRPPRRCSKQTLRNNMPAATAKEYFRKALFIPFLDSLLQELNARFSTITKEAIQGLTLLPKHLNLINYQKEQEILTHYSSDLPCPTSFHQELKLWQMLWEKETDKPSTLIGTLNDDRSCVAIYPNITKILYLLLLAPITSCEVERSNSILRLVKNTFRSTMTEDRFNALTLMYVHKDIKLDYDEIIDMFAKNHPRKLMLLNPLE